ncbi:hypothetical protein DM02DRAFT_661072 [Periconia macrospinosa]|uniref:Aminoglycoside phosphotransferase domain-containing protein n=1 Tax=Periconia macrospinosa TaxID=97972 RepID=A0A2V1DB52_9PLEO|nr:hypothetical protein DM02DRAFT_661072 [Periconia macrospinosa]
MLGAASAALSISVLITSAPRFKLVQKRRSMMPIWLPRPDSWSPYKLSAQVNEEFLTQRASELNQGISCKIDPTYPMGRRRVGGRHAHLGLVFPASEVYLARLPRVNYTSFDDKLSNDILLNECATLEWPERIEFPAPRPYDYGLRHDPRKGVGVAFMLISEAHGRPLNQLTATREQLEKVYAQLADLYTKLSQHPFHQIGSLTIGEDDNVNIGPFTGNRTGTLSYLGPFNNANDYYFAWAKEY